MLVGVTSGKENWGSIAWDTVIGISRLKLGLQYSEQVYPIQYVIIGTKLPRKQEGT